MAFDVEGALKEGYTQEQIDAYIQQNNIILDSDKVTPEPIEEVTEEVITTPTPQPSPEPIQKTFDVEGALREGYTQEQIDTYLKRKKTFDVEGALKEGYTQEQIDNYLQGNTPQQTQQQRDLENESDGLRGFDQYGNQLGGLYGAGKILLGKLFGSDDMIVSGLGYMNRSDEAVQARGVRDTDTFVNAWDKGVYEVITDWLPYNLGQAVGIGLETIAVALVGGIAGSAIGPTGTVSGLLGGLVAKKIVKKTIIDEARKIAKEEGKDAAKEFVAKEVTKALADPKKNAILRNEVNKAVGRNVALTGMAAKFGAGETVGRAVDEAIKDTENPAEQLAIIKELSTGRLASLSAAHAVADFIGARILLKPLQALAKPTQKFLLRFAKKFMMAAPGEAITEVIQSFIERYAAELPLADKEAIIEYVNASAAGFVMPAPTSFLGSIRDYQPSKIKEDKKDDLDPELEPEVDDNKDPRQQAINNILNDEKNIIKAEEEEKSAKKIGRTKLTVINEEMLKDLGINPKTNAGKELLGKDLTDLDNMEMIEKILDNENLQVKRNQKAVDNFKRKIKRDRKKLLKAQEEAQDEKQPTPKGQGTGAGNKVSNKSKPKSVITTGTGASNTTTVDANKSDTGGDFDATGTVNDTLKTETPKTETPKIEIEKKNPLVKGKKGNKAKVARINNGKVEVLEGVLEEGDSGLELIGKGRNNTKITTFLNEQQILNPTKKDLERLEVKAKQAKPASTPEVKPKTKPKKKLLGDTLNEATEEELNAEGYESFIELDKDGNEKKRYRNIKTKKPLFAKETTDTEKKLTEVRKQKQLAIERAENQRNQDGRVSPAYRKPIMQLQQMEDELLKQDAQEKKQSTPEQQELFAKDETIADTGETKQSVMSSFISEFGKNVNLGVKRGLLNIVDTVADLPNIIPNVDNLPANVKAIYFDGKAYFIADRITKEDAPRMLLHEIGAHYGLVGMLGKANYDRIVKSLRSKKTSDTEIEAAFIYVRDSYPELAESSDDFIQEVIANIAEDAPNNTIYRRIVGYIKNFLSKLGMGWNVDNITAAQIQDMVQHSVRVSLAQPDITSSTRTALASKDLETAGNVFYSPLEKAINKQKIESMSVQEWKDYLSKRARKEGFVNQLDATGILDWMNMLQRRRDILDKNLPNAPIDIDGFDLDNRGRLSKSDILAWLGQYDVLVVDVIPEGAMSESEIENMREEETARLTEEIMSSGRYEDMYAEIEEQAGFIDETIPGVYRVFGSEHRYDIMSQGRATDPEFNANEEPYAIFIDESLIGSENFNLTPIDVIASETNEGVIIDKQPALAYLKLAKDKGFDVRIVKQEDFNLNYTAEDSARDYLYETHNPEQENIGGQLQDEVDNEVAQRVDEIINEATYERDEGTYRDMQRTRDDGGVPEEYFEIVLSLDNKGGSQNNIYTSDHFEAIQNPILSIRADIRYDQDGNKVLFVEELQSDWAEGIRKDNKSSQNKDRDLAYVEDTQLWTKLAIKRIIRLAAENEVDKVAFLNSMQAVSVHYRTDVAAEEYYGKILPSVLRKTLNSLENTSRQKNEIIRFKPIYKVDDTTLDLLREIYELHADSGSSIREFDNIDYTPADAESFRKFQKTNELVSKLNEMYDSLDSFRDIYEFANRIIKITQDYNTNTDLLRPETRKATLERLASEFYPMDAIVKKREFLTKQIDKLDAQIQERTNERLPKGELVDKRQDLQAQRSSLPNVDYNRYNMLNLIIGKGILTIPDMTNEQVGFTMTPKLQKVAQAGMPLFAKQGSLTKKQIKQEIEDGKTNKEKINDKRKKAGQKTDDPADPFYNSNEWKKPMSKIRGFQNAVFGYDIGLYNKLRDEITRISKTKSVKEAQKFIEDTLARISIAQAVHAETLAGAFKEMGNIIFDPAIEKFEVIRDTYNLRSIENMVRKFAKKRIKGRGVQSLIVTKDDIADAEKFISQAITALQFKRIKENNKVLEDDARRLVRQGKNEKAKKKLEGYVYVDQTDAQLDKMIERFDDYPEIKEIQQSWIGVKNNVLQFLLDTEVIDQEQFDEYTLVGGLAKDSLDKLREDVFVPLYREGQPQKARPTRKGTSSGRGIFVPRKGSIEPVDNIFLNMDIFVQAAITQGIANKTALQKIRTALEVQAEEDLIVRPTAERTDGFEANAVEVSEIGPDGKQRKQLYEYSNIMYAKATNGAAKAMELGQGFISTLGRNTATVLRDFVVLNPVFGLAQTFVQDMNSAIFASNLRYGAIMIPLRVLYEFPATILNISSTHKTLKRYAAAGGYAFKQNDNNIDADINAPGFYNAMIRRLSRIPGTNIPTGITQEGALRLGDTRLSIGGLLNRIAMASDNSVRQAVYKQALMENKSHHRALETAFEIINFRKSGDHGLITFGRQYIPFFGAALQALSVQGKILQGLVKPNSGVTASTVAEARLNYLVAWSSVAGMTLMYNILMDDEEDKIIEQFSDQPVSEELKRYLREMRRNFNQLDNKIRDRRFIIGDDGFHLTLRPDFNTYVAKVIPEQVYNNIIAENQDAAKFWTSIKRNAREIISLNLIPQVVRPMVDVYYNEDSRSGRPIIPTRMENLPPELQVLPSSTEAAKKIGAIINTSPIIVDYYFRQYFGYAGGLATMLAESYYLEADTNPYRKNKPAKTTRDKIASFPGMTNFYSRDKDNRFMADFYELKNKVSQITAIFRTLDNSPNPEDGIKAQDFLNEGNNQKLYDASKQINKIQEKLSTIRKARQNIYDQPATALYDGRLMTDEFKRLLLKDLEQQEVDVLHTIHDLRVSIYGTNPFYNIETGEFFPGFDMTDLFEKGN